VAAALFVQIRRTFFWNGQSHPPQRSLLAKPLVDALGFTPGHHVLSAFGTIPPEFLSGPPGSGYVGSPVAVPPRRPAGSMLASRSLAASACHRMGRWRITDATVICIEGRDG